MLTLMLVLASNAHASCTSLTVRDTLTCSSVVSDQVTASTSSQLGSSSAYSCGSPYANVYQSAGEHVYAFTCQRTGTVRLEVSGMDCDLDIYVLGDTCDTYSDCDAGSTSSNTTVDTVNFSCTAGTTYYVVVEAFGHIPSAPSGRCGSSGGNYTLSFDVSAGTGCPEDCQDGVDNDYDGDIDCDDSDCSGETYCHCDDDLDGFDGTACGGADCDDTDYTVYPGATETCDLVDEDCDGSIDESAIDALTWYADTDGDNFGDPASITLDCQQPSAFVANDDDCDDTSAGINPAAAEIAYDGIDQDCDGLDLVDLDGDGDSATWGGGTDCDDSNATVNPGAREDADGIDDDCDGVVDEGTDWFDDDGDGWSEDGGDCDDGDNTVNPGGAETVDSDDEDCDGITDEGTVAYDDDGDGLTELAGDCNDGDSGVSPSRREVAGNGVDDDCDGQVDDGIPDPDHDGYTDDGGDCDSDDPATYPGAPETVDGQDNDCDGVADEGTSAYDNDGDGASADAGDCDDTDRNTGTAATEVQNGRDDDCDGMIDEGSTSFDDDGDGFTEVGGDCDDALPHVHPGDEDPADGLDNDCDGTVDEGVDDLDGDGFTADDGDCDDNDGWVQPGLDELCDGIDNDCDAEVDEGCSVATSETDTPVATCGCSDESGKALLLGLLAAPLVRRRRRPEAAQASDNRRG